MKAATWAALSTNASSYSLLSLFPPRPRLPLFPPWDALPPLLAISFCFLGSIEAKPLSSVAIVFVLLPFLPMQ
jgi:hypothetical protein